MKPPRLLNNGLAVLVRYSDHCDAVVISRSGHAYEYHVALVLEQGTSEALARLVVMLYNAAQSNLRQK